MFMLSAIAFSQQINFDRLGKERFLQYGGGISANTVFYEGTGQRNNLTYVLTGNLNVNLAGIYHIPLSFAYSNQGFNTPNPFSFNRLSLSPSYKWITLHLGSTNMQFSPYTLSSHQFDGVGLELAPGNRFKVALMYGRFLKATEYDPENPNNLVAYKRIGYGLKTSYQFEDVLLGMSFFRGEDDERSLTAPIPLDIGVVPGENTAISLHTEMNLWDKARVNMEYAISGVTEDVRLADTEVPSHFFSFLLNGNASTQFYSAFKTALDYPAGNGSLGLGYERIDPNYRTFGAYFFNNDLENITVNANQTIFDNALGINLNVGLQRDNLDDAKVSDMKQLVSSVNLNYTASEKLNMNGSYSNFQSFTNIQDQFDYINQVNQLQNADTLNYRQVSQNTNFGVNYQLKNEETKQQSLRVNLTYQQSKNEQEGEAAAGGDNVFYNGTAALSLGYLEHSLVITPAAHVSYNTVGITDAQWILGPTLGVAKQFLDKKLRTNFSASYNATFVAEQAALYNLNFRLGGNYTVAENHQLQCNFLSLFRSGTSNSGTDFTLTLGYAYNFSGNKNKANSNSKENDDHNGEDKLRFRHHGKTYEGTKAQIQSQLEDALKTHFPNNSNDKDYVRYKIFLQNLKQEHNPEAFKLKALAFLEELQTDKPPNENE